MNDRRIIGVDPGGRDCGVVVRSRAGVHFRRVVHHASTGPIPDAGYLNECADAVGEAVVIAELGGDGMTPWGGIEAVQAPSGFRRGARTGDRTPIDPENLIGVSMCFGGILTVFPFLVIVPPGANGAADLRSYPRELIGGPHNEVWPHAEPKGDGRLRHTRSAWDVAGLVPRYVRVRAAEATRAAG